MHLHRAADPYRGGRCSRPRRSAIAPARPRGAQRTARPDHPRGPRRCCAIPLPRWPRRCGCAGIRPRNFASWSVRWRTRCSTWSKARSAGLFDAPTTVRLDFAAPMQSVDISRLDGRGEDAGRHGPRVCLLLGSGGHRRTWTAGCAWSCATSSGAQVAFPRWSARSTPTFGYRAPRAPFRSWPPTACPTSKPSASGQRRGRHREQPHRDPATSGSAWPRTPGRWQMTRDAISFTDTECETSPFLRRADRPSGLEGGTQLLARGPDHPFRR